MHRASKGATGHAGVLPPQAHERLRASAGEVYSSSKPGREEGMFGMWQGTNLSALPVTSYELLIAGGALLICAALLLSLKRKTRVVVESSVVTEELMAYLGRIANAMERLQMPASDAITKDVLLRLQEMANVKQGGKVKEMPLTFSDR
jgi:hypothetical protein